MDSTVDRQPGSEKLAVLFTDMQGSSEFYREHGNLAGRIMIRRLNDMLFPVVRANGGAVLKTIGDSIMASFDSAQAALRAAVSMQKRLQKHNRESDSKERLLIRIAMNFGQGIVEDKDVYGDVVNVAGKLISVCEARQIILTESMYREIANEPGIRFLPYDMKDKRGKLSDVQVYQVDWEVAGDSQDPWMYLLSLRVESGAEEAAQPSGMEKLLFFIENRADKIITAEEAEINAAFSDMMSCLETAGKAVRYHLDFSSEQSDLPQVTRIGLHAFEASDAGNDELFIFFEGAVTARDNAEPYEIIVTADVHARMPADLQKSCIPIKNRTYGGRPLYVFHGAGIEKEKSVFTPIVPAGVPSDIAMCFYCGSSVHQPATCPSKHIVKSTNYLDVLGYMPLKKIRNDLQDMFSDIVRPLESDADEERFDVLFRENKNDPYTVCFFSYYELWDCFQLRFLRQLYMNDSSKKQKAEKKPGAVIMGEDCLRVSRYSEASDWFEKAITEQPNDYRPHVAMGILSIERNRPRDAVFHFNKALTFSLIDAQKRHIHLLIARVYEVAGGLKEALQETHRTIMTNQDWTIGNYYYAVLLVKAGRWKKAMEIFRRLIYQSPRYYFMIALNSQLITEKKEIIAFLNRELIAIRNYAQRSFAAMQKILDDNQGFFHADDEDYCTAVSLHEKASEIFKNESVAGLMDIPGMEVNMKNLINRAQQYRQVKLRKKITAHRDFLKQSASYLSRYPYKQFLSQSDYRRLELFEAQLDRALEKIAHVPPPSPQDSAVLMDLLSREAAKISSQRARLEAMKSMLFAGECSSKTLGIVTGIASLTVVFFTVILFLYEGYENSFASITAEKIGRFITFGIFAGVFFGIMGGIAWIVKKYPKLQNKMNR